MTCVDIIFTNAGRALLSKRLGFVIDFITQVNLYNIQLVIININYYMADSLAAAATSSITLRYIDYLTWHAAAEAAMPFQMLPIHLSPGGG